VSNFKAQLMQTDVLHRGNSSHLHFVGLNMNLRSKLLQGGAVPREPVDVIVDGEKLTIECRGLSAAARGRLMTTSMVKVSDEDDAEERIDLAKVAPELVIEGAYDPATGERIFSEADLEVVGSMSAGFLDPIIASVSKLSGLSQAAAKVMEGNSVATTTSVSASPSLVS
jgi:hypothetical protein